MIIIDRMYKKPTNPALTFLSASRYFLIGLILSGSLSGCFIADEFLLPEEKTTNEEESLQKRSEAAVKAYLFANKKSDRYDPYGFGDLKIIKPVELKQLDKLERQYMATKSEEKAAEIDSLKKYIRENRIERRVEIEHFFTLKDSVKPKTIQVLESKFILNDTLGVIDFKPQIFWEMDPKLEDVLVYYFFEYTIFLGDTYKSSKELSKKFYDFFKERLEQIKNTEAKSKFLEHVIGLCAYVKKNGAFEPEEILKENVISHVTEKRNDIADYKPIKFSTLFAKESIEKENISEPQGYYFFHKFIGSYENETDTNVVMVEFSEYYEIDKIYQMERPFDRYFKN